MATLGHRTKKTFTKANWRAKKLNLIAEIIGTLCCFRLTSNIKDCLISTFYLSLVIGTSRLNMAEDKTVLVCFGRRHREVKFQSGSGICCDVDTLERNIRHTFADVESLTSNIKLILQVCTICKFINKYEINVFNTPWLTKQGLLSTKHGKCTACGY